MRAETFFYFNDPMKEMEIFSLLFIRHVHAICQMDGRGGEHCFGEREREKGLKFRSFVGGGASLNEAAHKMTATKIQGSDQIK